MFSVMKKSICAIAALTICLGISISAMASSLQNALPIESRMDEVIEGALYKYIKDGSLSEKEKWNEYCNNINNMLNEGNAYNFYYDDDSFVSRADAIECIMKVIGLTDDLSSNAPSVVTMSTDILDTFNFGSIYAQNYIWSASNMASEYAASGYDPNDKTGCKGCLTLLNTEHNSEYMFYPERYCTIKEALMFIARAIDADCSEDYVCIALANDICDVGTIAQENEYITVSLLREMLIKFYGVKGDVYYNNLYDGSGSIPKIDSDSESTYYEKYQKMHTFNIYSITENGYGVSAAENGWGTKLVKLRDIMAAHNIDTEWDNGRIKLTDANGIEHVIYLDRTEGQARVGNDNALCMYISKEESLEYKIMTQYFGIILFGQYEMINDSVYLYPQTLFSLFGYMGIKLELTTEYFDYYRDDQRAYGLWENWIWPV